jgi:hypothetical protein
MALPKRANPDEPRDAARDAAIVAAVLGLGLTVGALAMYGTRTGLSIALGAAIAVANLVTLRAIVRALVRSPDQPDAAPDAAGPDAPTDENPENSAPAPDHGAEGKRGGAAWGIFALVKILVLFGGIWMLLTRGLVDPIPLVIGYGVLPLGIAAASAIPSLAPRARQPRR